MASRWYPGRQDETEGRWACHLSLFYATERVPDAINVLQVHGHNMQYSRGRRPPRRRGASGATRGPARLAVPGTAFIVAAPAVAAQPNPPGARPVRPSFRRHRLCRRGAPGAARGVISQSAPPPPLRLTRSKQTAPPSPPSTAGASFHFLGRLDSDKDSIACAVCGAEWGLLDGAPLAPRGASGHLLTGE